MPKRYQFMVTKTWSFPFSIDHLANNLFFEKGFILAGLDWAHPSQDIRGSPPILVSGDQYLAWGMVNVRTNQMRPSTFLKRLAFRPIFLVNLLSRNRFIHLGMDSTWSKNFHGFDRRFFDGNYAKLWGVQHLNLSSSQPRVQNGKMAWFMINADFS